jgi:ribosomal protein S18 acetylase RimI-like enzyme
MIIRNISPNESSILADIHLIAFKDFFLTSLGRSFLQTYYKTCINEHSTIAICAVDQYNQIIGFATGTIESSGYHKKLLRNNFFQYFFSVGKMSLFNPRILIRLILNIEKKSSIIDKKNYAELLSIAVLPEFKGSGVGKLLLDSFENNIEKRGGKRIALTTDYDNNDPVIKFYKKCGYKIFYDFKTYPNRRMYKMIKNIDVS